MGVQNYNISTVLSKKTSNGWEGGYPLSRPPRDSLRFIHYLGHPSFSKPWIHPEDRHVTDIPQVFHIRTDV